MIYWYMYTIVCIDLNIFFAGVGLKIMAFPGPPSPDTLHVYGTCVPAQGSTRSPIHGLLNIPDRGMFHLGKCRGVEILHGYLRDQRNSIL